MSEKLPCPELDELLWSAHNLQLAGVSAQLAKHIADGRVERL